jgi:hypothetical protein
MPARPGSFTTAAAAAGGGGGGLAGTGAAPDAAAAVQMGLSSVWAITDVLQVRGAARCAAVFSERSVGCLMHGLRSVVHACMLLLLLGWSCLTESFAVLQVAGLLLSSGQPISGTYNCYL